MNKTALALTLVLALLVSGLTILVLSLRTDYEAPQLEWTETYGYISGVSIVRVNDTDWVIAAEAGTDWYYFGHGEYDYTNRTGALFKLDLTGEVKWRKQLPVNPVTLLETNDNGFAIAGWTRRRIGSDHLGLPLYGYFTSFVKTDSEGNVLWNQPYENQTDVTPASVQVSRLSVNSVIQTTDGGFVLGGYQREYRNSWYYYRACLMKTNSSGNMLWINYYGIERENMGAIQNGVQEVVQTADNGFLFAGYLDGAIIVKTDSMGEVQWTKTYDDITFYSMLKTKEDDFVFAGYQGEYENAYVVKLDAGFNTVCNRAYEHYSSFSIQESVDDGYLFISSISGGSTLIKTDLGGNIEWTYKSNGTIRSAIQTEVGKYALAGKIHNPITGTKLPRDITEVIVQKLALISSVASSPISPTEIIETWHFTAMLVIASFIVVAMLAWASGLLQETQTPRR